MQSLNPKRDAVRRRLTVQENKHGWQVNGQSEKQEYCFSRDTRNHSKGIAECVFSEFYFCRIIKELSAKWRSGKDMPRGSNSSF